MTFSVTSCVTFVLFHPFLRAFQIGDAFVGFHEDTIPSIVMQVCHDLEEEGGASQDGPEDPWQHEVAQRCKNMLLDMATPDAIARLPASGLKAEAREIWQIYFHEQQHSSLATFMRHTLDDFDLGRERKKEFFIQVKRTICWFWFYYLHSHLVSWMYSFCCK